MKSCTKDETVSYVRKDGPYEHAETAELRHFIVVAPEIQTIQSPRRAMLCFGCNTSLDALFELRPVGQRKAA